MHQAIFAGTLTKKPSYILIIETLFPEKKGLFDILQNLFKACFY